MRYPIAALVVLLCGCGLHRRLGLGARHDLVVPRCAALHRRPAPHHGAASIPVTTTTTAGAPVRPAALWLAGDGSLATLEPNSGAVVIRAPITDQSVSTDLAFGFASIWAADPEAGAVVRIDPTTGRLSAQSPSPGDRPTLP